VVPTTSAEETTTTEGPDSSSGPGTSTEGTSSEGTSAGSTSTGEETETATTGQPIDCNDLSDGPFEPVLVVEGFDGSEDLAFDGQGGLALKKDGGVVVIAADLSETVLTPSIPQAYGTRFLGDGRLLVALPGDDVVIAVDPDGALGDFVMQVQGPNGIFPDLDGNVWITEFGGDRVIRVAPDLTETTIAMGDDAASANGVVFDPDRGLLFFTNYQDGLIRRVAIAGDGSPGAAEVVVEIEGAAPDGLAMDACGYLYVVDQGGGALHRVLLDELGMATNDPNEPIAVFASNVANAQFGVGAGWDPHTLYLSGNPGDVYAVQVEFPGAPIP
jgi:sugar lactone lactonase YvrE